MVNDTNNNDNINNAEVGEKWSYSWDSGNGIVSRNATIVEVPNGDSVKVKILENLNGMPNINTEKIKDLTIPSFTWKKVSSSEGGRSKTRKNKKKLKKRKNKSRKYFRKSYIRK